MIQIGLFRFFETHLVSIDQEVKKQTLWALSNFLHTTDYIIDMFINDSKVISILLDIVKHPISVQIEEDLFFSITNFFNSSSFEQVCSFVEGFLNSVTPLLLEKNLKQIELVLNSLDSLFEKDKNSHFVKKFEKLNGFYYLEGLRFVSNNNICSMASRMYHKFNNNENNV